MDVVVVVVDVDVVDVDVHERGVFGGASSRDNKVFFTKHTLTTNTVCQRLGPSYVCFCTVQYRLGSISSTVLEQLVQSQILSREKAFI